MEVTPLLPPPHTHEILKNFLKKIIWNYITIKSRVSLKEVINLKKIAFFFLFFKINIMKIFHLSQVTITQGFNQFFDIIFLKEN